METIELNDVHNHKAEHASTLKFQTEVVYSSLAYLPPKYSGI
jgi:hypothetical protein